MWWDKIFTWKNYTNIKLKNVKWKKPYKNQDVFPFLAMDVIKFVRLGEGGGILV